MKKIIIVFLLSSCCMSLFCAETNSTQTVRKPLPGHIVIGRAEVAAYHHPEDVQLQIVTHPLVPTFFRAILTQRQRRLIAARYSQHHE